MNANKLSRIFTLLSPKIARSYTGPRKGQLMMCAHAKAVGSYFPSETNVIPYRYLSNRGRIAKPRRASHIHTCRHIEQAHYFNRDRSEIKYCYVCFHWFTIDDWEKHCQLHLDAIKSKNCATITYCHTLLRPAFCPFCLGGIEAQMSASKRWSSWTRENQLREHLATHLAKAKWPMKCPHPLCKLNLVDATSFAYHLSDSHRLVMNERQQETLITGSNDRKCHKRKAIETISFGPSPAKQAKGDLVPQESVPPLEISSSSPLDNLHPSPLGSDGVPVLTYSGGSSVPESYEPSLVDDDTLFTQYLRSRSSSSSPGRRLDRQDDGSTNTMEDCSSDNTCKAKLPTELNTPSLDVGKSDRPRLRLSHPKPPPRVRLLLHQPKQKQKQKANHRRAV